MRLVTASLTFYLIVGVIVAQKPTTQSPLSCEIVAPKELHFVNGGAEARLMLTNISPETVRVCEMYQEWRGVGGNKFSVVLRPDAWKCSALTK